MKHEGFDKMYEAEYCKKDMSFAFLLHNTKKEALDHLSNNIEDPDIEVPGDEFFIMPVYIKD